MAMAAGGGARQAGDGEGSGCMGMRAILAGLHVR